MKQFIAIAFAGATMVGAANASTVSTHNYADYQSGGYAAGYYDFEKDGVTMTVTAGLFSDAANPNVQASGGGSTPHLYDGNGIGISRNGDNQHTVDGNLPEVAILSFSTTVTLTDIAVKLFSDFATFDFFVDSDDNGSLDTRVVVDSPFSGSMYAVDTVTLSDVIAANFLTGKLFGIGTSFNDYTTVRVCGRHGCYDQRKKILSEWKLSAVSFEETPEVPLPAALPLFLAGLGGLGFAGRRKAKQA